MGADIGDQDGGSAIYEVEFHKNRAILSNYVTRSFVEQIDRDGKNSEALARTVLGRIEALEGYSVIDIIQSPNSVEFGMPRYLYLIG